MPRGRDPGGTNFHSSVDAVDVHKASASNYASGCALNCGKYHGFAAFLLGEKFFQEAFEILQRFHAVGNPAEDIVKRVFRGLPKEFRMITPNRLQADDGALQC